VASTTRQVDKAGWAGRTAAGASWSEFDMLPRGVKRLFWEAPYNYTAIGDVVAFKAGRDMRSLVMRQIAGMTRDVKREAIRLYGRTHPQARSGQW
jgi:hypothetical protein